MAFVIRYFALEAEDGSDPESPVVEFIEGLPARFRAAIISDVERVAEYGFKSPVSIKSIKRHSPMVEIRTADP
jgi:hypothetical protein